MTELLRMPELSAGATEALLQEWTVKEGDAFVHGQVLATIETDKALVDFEAPGPGVLVRLLAAAATTVPVGGPLAVIAAAPLSPAEVERFLSEQGVGSGGSGADTPEVAERLRTLTPVAESAAEVRERPAASPVARRLARDAGVDLAQVEGTGPGRRVVRADVLRFVTARSAVVSGGESRREPPLSESPTPHLVVPSPVRRAVARSLSAAKPGVPHFYLTRSVRMERMLTARAEVNDGRDAKVSVNDLVLAAVGIAYREVPEMNRTWVDDRLLEHDSVDLGMAIDTPRGLVTPVVRGVDRLRVTELASSTRDLILRARAGQLRQHELDGGVASVSNLGMVGVEEFAGIINPPQSALIAIGAIGDRVIVVDGEIRVEPMMTVTVSVDHRPLDGALAGRWLGTLVDLLEHPWAIVA